MSLMKVNTVDIYILSIFVFAPSRLFALDDSSDWQEVDVAPETVVVLRRLFSAKV